MRFPHGAAMLNEPRTITCELPLVVKENDETPQTVFTLP
jgi:hypothetical protein